MSQQETGTNVLYTGHRLYEKSAAIARRVKCRLPAVGLLRRDSRHPCQFEN